ncbi:MAG TPA: gliding motility-associated C-terminal domain-containing protein, partial [Bacteroidia bacterium]|nr:gliding motility-associated C-terminal domain-containing protein [Bacteroidia bacterium]
NDFTVPNVFTPNNDGQNDTFLIKAFYESTYNIEIYNRWGILVYKSTDPNSPWTGKDESGQMVSDGVYYYIIKSKCGDTDFNHHGFVQVIK